MQRALTSSARRGALLETSQQIKELTAWCGQGEPCTSHPHPVVRDHRCPEAAPLKGTVAEAGESRPLTFLSFPHGCDQKPEKSNIREEGINLIHSLKKGIWSIMVGRHGGRSVRQLVTSRLQSGSREKLMLALQLAFFSLFIHGPQPRGWCHPHQSRDSSACVS